MPYAGEQVAGRGPIRASDLGEGTYEAVDALVAAAPELAHPSLQLVVGSITDVKDISSTTAFGNTVSELIRSRLVQCGIQVTEMRLRSAVLMDPAGEMTLSRDRRQLRRGTVASQIIAGTYTVAATEVLVSLKVFGATSGHIYAAADLRVPRTMNMDRMVMGPPQFLR